MFKDYLTPVVPYKVMLDFLETVMEDLCIKIGKEADSEGLLLGAKNFQGYDSFSIAVQVGQRWRKMK